MGSVLRSLFLDARTERGEVMDQVCPAGCTFGKIYVEKVVVADGPNYSAGATVPTQEDCGNCHGTGWVAGGTRS